MTEHIFEAGVGRRDISPPQPTLLQATGMSRLVPTRGNLDPLYTEALAFRLGNDLAFVITADLRYWPIDWAREIRRRVAERTGCDEFRLLFSATHCHCSSPIPWGDSPDAKAAEDQANQHIRDGVFAACIEAYESLAPSEIAALTVTLTQTVGQNRRIQMSDGTCINGWGSGAPVLPGQTIVGPAGADPDYVDVLAVRHVGQTTPYALLVAYDAHPHMYELPMFSGEFAGASKRAIASQLPGCTVLHAMGTGGDIDIHCTHPMPDDADGQIQWFAQSIDTLGQRMSADIVPALAHATYTRPDTLTHHIQTTEPQDGEHQPRLTINTLALGDIAIASIPGEMFIELGRQIRAASPFAHLLLIAYNASGGMYCPPDDRYEQGSYEVMRGPTYQRVVHGQRIPGSQVTQQIIDTLHTLHRV